MKQILFSHLLFVLLFCLLACSLVRSQCTPECANTTYCYYVNWSFYSYDICAQLFFYDCLQPPVLQGAIYYNGGALFVQNVTLPIPINFAFSGSLGPCSVSINIPNGIPYPEDILYYLQFGIVLQASCFSIPYSKSYTVSIGDNNLQSCLAYNASCQTCINYNKNCVFCLSGTHARQCLAGSYQSEKCQRCSPIRSWEDSCQAGDDGSLAPSQLYPDSTKPTTNRDAVVGSVVSVGVVTIVGATAGFILCYLNPAMCSRKKKNKLYLQVPLLYLILQLHHKQQQVICLLKK